MDWLTSREIGLYGNREGIETNGKVISFSQLKKGDEIIQSIIEDLIGMRRGDIVFFHVIKEQTEGSVHGVYKVREEPFFNKQKIWQSSNQLVYPYRFCFEPHHDHIELCRYDASITVSEFYRLIEKHDVRSITTLEREVRGLGHAVKMITHDDARIITQHLYRDFSPLSGNPITFKPISVNIEPLRQHIRRVGEIEFAIKAIVSYELGQKNAELIQHFPACVNSEYEFLIETFVGQTMRRPTDILCIGKRNSDIHVTIIEAKTHKAFLDDFVQVLKYQDMFKLRNLDRGSLKYKMSCCILAQQLDQELVNYVAIRNMICTHDTMILMKYVPTKNGTDASFVLHPLTQNVVSSMQNYPRLSDSDFLRQITSDPSKFFAIFAHQKPPQKITLELELAEQEVVVLKTYFSDGNNRTLFGKILIHAISGEYTLNLLQNFMERLHTEAEHFRGDFLSIHPVIAAKSFDLLTTFFIEKYNTYESQAGKQPISAHTLS